MFPSMEVRWFYEGAIPEQMLNWFQHGEREPEDQQRRVDHYLRLGNMDSLGIKLREGRLEIKQRQRQHGVFGFHERAAGLVEHWRKWSLELAPTAGGLTSILAPASSWIGVQKGRRLWKYRLVGEGTLAAVPAAEFPPQGCSVELTEIHVEGQEWWSLCFEAFGDEAFLQETLMLATGHILAREGVPFILEAMDSYGYPEWLTVVQERAADRT